MRIPTEELALLERAVRDAYQLARAGEATRGYELLDLTLSWVETPPLAAVTCDSAPAEPWREALVDGYRAAMAAYCEAHGMAFPSPDAMRLTF